MAKLITLISLITTPTNKKATTRVLWPTKVKFHYLTALMG